MVRWLVIAALASSGCLRTAAGFHCAQDTDCGNGTCALGGYCAFPDSTCSGGERYGDGPLANQCVTSVPLDAAAGDATATDGRHDASGIQSPTLTAYNDAHDTTVTALSVTLTIPASSNRFLFVSVELSADTVSFKNPSVSTISYAGTPMTLLDSVTGVPDLTNTRTELWELTSPPVGTNDAAVVLAAPGVTIHANAMAFSGVDPGTPVRAVQHTSGEQIASTTTVISAVGDLVVSAGGQGDHIIGPAVGQTLVFLDNTDGTTSLNNAAGSTAPGAAPSVDMTWMYSDTDEFQVIAASLEP